MSDKPCTCWAQIALHEGHCCFGEMATESDELNCDHKDEGMKIHQRYKFSGGGS